MNTFRIKLPSINDAVLLSKICGGYSESIDYKCGRYTVDAASLMGILSIGIDRDDCEVIINTDNLNTLEKFKKDIELWT